MVEAVNRADKMIINTGLCDSASLNVLRSTIGQLSDGIWENSRKAERYWPFAEAQMINGNVCIVINKDNYKHNHYANGFRFDLNMDSIKIRNYFAKKIQAVVRENARDYPNSGIKCSSKCEAILDYMHDYDSGITHTIRACDAYRVYKELKG